MLILTFEVQGGISRLRIEGAAALLGCEIEEHVGPNWTIFRELTGPCLESKTGNPTRNIERWPDVLADLDACKARLRWLDQAPGRYVALLERHDRTAKKVVLVPGGQSLDFDKGTATRAWLHPHLGADWHLNEFYPL